MGLVHNGDLDAEFTAVDLNDAGTTPTVYTCPSSYDVVDSTVVHGVYMKNGGTSAEVELEVTDGTDTATIATPGAGNDLTFEGTVALSPGESLQIDVTTAEGSAETTTAVVFREERP